VERSDYLYVEEYKTLRAEILQNQKLRMWALAITFTAMGVLLGLPLKFSSQVNQHDTASILDKILTASSIMLPSVALYIVLLTGLVISYMLSRNITFIGRYIQCHFEADTNNNCQLQWASKLVEYKQYEDILAKRYHSPKIAVAYWHADLGLSIVAFFYAAIRCLMIWNLLGGSALAVVIIVYTPFIVYSVVLTWRLKKLGSEKLDFIKRWKEVL